jgi:hypothetical protein
MKKTTPISIDGICTGNERTIPFGMFGSTEAKIVHGSGGRRAVSWIADEEIDKNGKKLHSIRVSLFTMQNNGGKDEITFVAKRRTYQKCHSAMLQILYERNVAIIFTKEG